MARKLSLEDKKHLSTALLKNLPENRKPKADANCVCEGCSCPGGSGDICDGGTYVGYAGGYYGASIG
jgi:hypothetical protein